MEGIERIMAKAQELISIIEAEGYQVDNNSNYKSVDLAFFNDGAIAISGGLKSGELEEGMKFRELQYGIRVFKDRSGEIQDETERKIAIIGRG